MKSVPSDLPTTRRQRVRASIQRVPLDAIPWQFDLTSMAANRVNPPDSECEIWL
jgi:hypothetical protein